MLAEINGEGITVISFLVFEISHHQRSESVLLASRIHQCRTIDEVQKPTKTQTFHHGPDTQTLANRVDSIDSDWH